MPQVELRELLEAGVHFGHQTRRWNPKMRRFIHGERGGIYIIDLLQTKALLEDAQEFASTLAHRGGTVLFVGTKKQARDAVQDTAEAASMPYVNHRWLGGLLTNFQTISQRIKRLHDLERYENEGQLALLPTRERLAAEADLAKLRANLGGVKHMQRPPDAMFVIDLKTEVIAVREAQRLRIPIIGLVDTNCDPDGIDFVIPGNDDAIRSCTVVTRAIGDVVAEGQSVFRAEEERARQEAEDRARLEAEERARRDAEDRARREAEQRALREAQQAAATGEAPPPAPEPIQPAVAEPAADAGERAAQEAAASHDRAAQEAVEAEAVAEAGRPQPDAEAAVRQDADTEVAPANRDNVKGGSPEPAPPATDHTPDPAVPLSDDEAAETTETETQTEESSA
ncbi:MAG TPA: 30S ribosomal protein S2 [Solirubrobacteraceae bacterium]|jgi:small subunit ribosomal protein S2|nr:30S ribosomal protein S2 [Solirubrobacteraceae bacterium]